MGQATEILEPRLYVACLAAYNSGRLHGAWIDVGDDLGAVFDAVAKMLAASPEPGAEEYAIHDHEGFGGVEIGEFTPMARIVEVAAYLRGWGRQGRLAALVLAHLDGDIYAAKTAMEEGYRGRFASLADYVQELTEETTAIPEALRAYIDYEAMARDMALNCDVFTIETAHDEVHVFGAR